MSKAKAATRKVRYATNQVMQAGDNFYFVKKAKFIGENMFQVIGAKVDVTASIQALLDKREREWRVKARARKAST